MSSQNPWFSFQWGPLGSAANALLARKLSPALLDPAQLLLISNGGLSYAQFNAASVFKAAPGRMGRFIVITAGSAGAWTFNDCATVGAAATANEISSIAYNATGLVAGIPLHFDWPLTTGLVCSAVPTGGLAVLSWT